MSTYNVHIQENGSPGRNHPVETVRAATLPAAVGRALRKVVGKRTRGTLNQAVVITAWKTSIEDLPELPPDEPTLF